MRASWHPSENDPTASIPWSIGGRASNTSRPWAQKALGTASEGEAKRIKEDAEAQLDRIKQGRSPVAAKLLADGYSIVEVLYTHFNLTDSKQRMESLEIRF